MTVLPLPFMSYLDESEVVVKRGERASGGEISRGLFCSPQLLVGNLHPRAPAQPIGASSVGYVQFVARIVGYAAMS